MLPDPIEQLENMAENWYYDNVDGDNFTCGCGNVCPLDEGEPVSANPYAPPVCPSCSESYFKEKMVYWIVEKGAQYKELVEILDKTNRDYHLMDMFDYLNDFKDPYPGFKKIYHGSIQMILSQEEDIFFAFDNFKCSNYFPKYQKHLLTDEYEILPFGELSDKEDYLYEKFSIEDAIFMKPDTNDKLFTGQTVNKEDFQKAITQLLHDDNKEAPIVIGRPWKIKAEWRFFVRKGKVITGSQYRKNGKAERDSYCPPEAIAKALEIANEEWQPSPMYVVDICLSGDDYCLLEIGSWNCAGYYKADLEKIVMNAEDVRRNQ